MTRPVEWVSPSPSMFDSKWTQGNLKLIALSALMAALLALGAKIIADYRREVNDPGPTDPELLEQLRAAHDSGEIDDEEFRRVQEVLARDRPEGGPEPMKDRPKPPR